MTRVRHGYIARRHQRKIYLFASSFRGKIRALVSSYRHRGRQKRDFCHLWITRINAVTHENGVPYSRLIHDLRKKRLLNRKILAQIAISNRNCLYMISNDIIK
ncbi:unnamed protein product [Victoria cruziana]